MAAKTTLKEVQEEVAFMVSGNQRHRAASKFSRNFIKFVPRSDPLGGSEQFAVYRYAYLYRLITTLSWDFRSIYLIVGEKRFSRMAREYLREYPPRHWSLHFIGMNFHRFLNRDSTKRKWPFLPDLARFEWEMIRVQAGRSERQVSFHWPVDTIWEKGLQSKVLPSQVFTKIKLVIWIDHSMVRYARIQSRGPR